MGDEDDHVETQSGEQPAHLGPDHRTLGAHRALIEQDGPRRTEQLDPRDLSCQLDGPAHRAPACSAR